MTDPQAIAEYYENEILRLQREIEKLNEREAEIFSAYMKNKSEPLTEVGKIQLKNSMKGNIRLIRGQKNKKIRTLRIYKKKLDEARRKVK